MKAKLRQMGRVRNVRATRERLSEASLAIASVKLREAEHRLAEAKESELAGARDAALAMDAGERLEWAMSLALQKAFGLDCERMEKERGQCEEELQDARDVLRTRRIETEQATVLHRNVREALLMEEERRAQAEGVDRFLARGRWGSARGSVNSLIEAA
jgi:hypothetical protein